MEFATFGLYSFFFLLFAVIFFYSKLDFREVGRSEEYIGVPPPAKIRTALRIISLTAMLSLFVNGIILLVVLTRFFV